MTDNTIQTDTINLRINAFNKLLESSRRGVALLDERACLTYCNDTAHAMLGLPENVPDGGELLSFIPSCCSQFGERLPDIIERHQPVRFEAYCSRLDTWLTVEYAPLENGAMLYMEDISAWKKQAEEIEELARFPEETWNPVMKFDIEGQIVYTNSRCSAILHTWQTALFSKVPEEIVTEIKTAITKNEAREVDVACDNGQIFSILLAPVPEANAVYVYGRDVSKLKQNEQELLAHRDHLEELVSERTGELKTAVVEAERANKAKSMFLANMSHEIRTPLSAIIGFAENLLDDATSREERDKFINTIIRSGNHLTKIINDVLDLSKIEADKVEIELLDVNLFELLMDIQSLIGSQAKNKGLDFKLNFTYPLPKTICTDPIRLRQILLNLCSNALKFTAQGYVALEVKCDSNNQTVTFDVKDTGIGLTSDQQQKIFKPFTQADTSTTRQYGGTGLGLTLSKNLAMLLGGNLTVESLAGKGSCFSLMIATGDLGKVEQVHQIPIYETIPDRPLPNVKGKLSGSILLAEDTPDLQALSTSIIEKTGAEVTLVENGLQAVEEALRGTYKLVLMDMQMPVMDGYTATRTLREKGYSGPIVAMTANTLKEDRERAMESGCDGFVGKPVDRVELYRVLGLYLDATDDKEKSKALISSLLDEDPDLTDLVEKFVQKLPSMIDDLQHAYNARNWQQLAKQLHQLKGIGGSHGYMIVSQLAADMEQHIREEDFKPVQNLLQTLREVSQQARAGLQLHSS